MPPAEQGIAEMLTTTQLPSRLHESLFAWHRMLEGPNRHQVGRWRAHGEPMQVVSGRCIPKVHFEAPSTVVPKEMTTPANGSTIPRRAERPRCQH